MAPAGDMQLTLGLPQPLAATGKVRIWLLAPERTEDARAFNAHAGLHLGPEARHIFVDAENGNPVFSPSDLIMVRRSAGSAYTLMVAAGNEAPAGLHELAAALGRQLRDPEASGVRGAMVRNITCLVCPLAKGAGENMLPRITRSGFERAVGRIASAVASGSVEPATVLTDCVAAAASMSRTSHPAIEALLARAKADTYSVIRHRTGDLAYGLRAVPLWDRSSRVFASAGLRSVVRELEAEAAVRAAELQPDLPGLPPGLRPDDATARADYTVVPVMAFAIDLDMDVSHAAPRRWNAHGSIPRYRPAGRIEMEDSRIFAIVDPVRSSSRRLTSKVAPTDSGYRIRIALMDSMQALLGLATASGDCRGMDAISIRSPTLTFDPPGLSVVGGEPVDIDARTRQSCDTVVGGHDVDVRVLMSDGGTTRLGFNIPSKMSGGLVYA